jgi:hypothetical protein
MKASVVRIFCKCRNGVHGFGAVCATAIFRSHPRRWAKVASAGKPIWDQRNKILASFVPPGSSVVDLGCGAKTLQTHLPPSCSYQPCDLVQSSREVIVCDFNAGKYPRLPRRYSHVVCSGVFEYIREPKDFLKRVATYGDNLLLSYNPLRHGGSRIKRMTNNWCNHFTKPEIESLFAETCLAVELLNESEAGELIYRLKTSNVVENNF